MNFKTITILLLILLLTSSAWSQCYYTEILDEHIIGPKNVSWKLESQRLFYSNKYNNHIDTLNKYQFEYEAEIKKIKKKHKKRISIRGKKQIEIIEGYIEELQEQRDSIYHYVSLWRNLETINKGNVLNELDFTEKCYDIVGSKGVYSAKEYKVIEVNAFGRLHWTEYLEPEMKKTEYEKVLVERGKEVWVKKKADRNCLSKDPNDCVVWCLLSGLDHYKHVVTDPGGKYCPETYFLEAEEQHCVKGIELDFEVDETGQNRDRLLKLIEIDSGDEIEMLQAKVVSCEGED